MQWPPRAVRGLCLVRQKACACWPAGLCARTYPHARTKQPALCCACHPALPAVPPTHRGDRNNHHDDPDPVHAPRNYFRAARRGGGHRTPQGDARHVLCLLISPCSAASARRLLVWRRHVQHRPREGKPCSIGEQVALLCPLAAAHPAPAATAFAQAGSPWGAATFAGADGSRQPTDVELGYAQHQVGRLGGLAGGTPAACMPHMRRPGGHPAAAAAAAEQPHLCPLTFPAAPPWCRRASTSRAS